MPTQKGLSGHDKVVPDTSMPSGGSLMGPDPFFLMLTQAYTLLAHLRRALRKMGLAPQDYSGGISFVW